MTSKKKKTDPLSVEEMQAAAAEFVPLFEVVRKELPDTARVEDVLKVMEAVSKLGHHKRAQEKKVTGTFGFNKQQNK